MILKFALRDLLRHWRFTIFFIFNLTIGLTGFVTLETFKTALQSHLAANAKSILAADIAVEARRDLTDNELQAFKQIPAIKEALVYDFFAMASSSEQSKLVSIKAVTGNFPLYGSLDLRSGRQLTINDLHGQAKAWVYPEVLEQFQLKLGDSIKLGRLNFIIDDIIEKDSTQTFRSAAMAPRIYIPVEQLKATDLIQFGSTYSKEWLFKIKEDSSLNSIKEAIYKDITDPAVRIETPDSASEDSGRQLNYLSDYLGLVTLVALFLSALGAAYLFRLYMQDKLKDIAILRSLGLRSQQALWVYLAQTFFLGLFAITVSFIFALTTEPILNSLLSSLLPFSLQLRLNPSVFLTGFILAVLGSTSISLPYLLKIKEISVSQLFSEEHFQSQIGVPNWLALTPALILFTTLSIYQSHSFKMGFGFTAGLALVLVVLAIFAWLTLSLVTRWPLKTWSLKYSFLSLQRKKIGSLALFVSLALGALLINILPQLKVTLQNSMSVEDGSKLPSLFIFDVQDEQVTGIKSYFAEHKKPLLNFSPMVRARILKINDQDYERTIDNKEYKTREEERDARFRNRGVNLTYRNELSESEEIIEGVPFNLSVPNLNNSSSAAGSGPGTGLEPGTGRAVGNSNGNSNGTALGSGNGSGSGSAVGSGNGTAIGSGNSSGSAVGSGNGTALGSGAVLGNDTTQIAQLSVEHRYADRLGLKVGDLLSFDVQGIEVKGRIINFRSVRWTSFQPNFFIVMQPGFLEDAPKTFIGSVARLPQIEKLAIQKDFAKIFSNVSIIDVDHLVTDILKVAEQMSLSLELMAWLSILAGYVVLYSIVKTQVQSRRWELNMLKILGAKQKDLSLYILTEITIITLLASNIGAGLSLVGSAMLSHFVFESSLKIHYTWLFSSIVGISILSIFIAWLAARQVMLEKAHHILTDIN